MDVVNVEIITLQERSSNKKSIIIALVESYLKSNDVFPNTVITDFTKENDPFLAAEIKAVIVDVPSHYNEKFHFNSSKFQVNWYVYTVDDVGTIQQVEEDNEEEIHLSTHLTLPSTELFSLWENLYYEENIKENLLQYAQTMMEFSDKGVDNNVVSCNRVILLHGPPGTGKTSLCKALAQKLTVRMNERYHAGILIEINSHSLFSKWFSESGKLVTKMFSKIKEIVQNPKLLVCVLIDEVESLAHARNQCLSGSEPSDSIRVVNALLTQIDQIKRHPNVLILTTSNMTEAIDLAFIDRADIKQYLGLPTAEAIYKIYYSCIQELMKTQIINSQSIVDPVNVAFNNLKECQNVECTKKLIEVCVASSELSGRSLRKIPFIAHALYLNSSNVDLDDFLIAMLKAVQREKHQRNFFSNLSQK